MSSTGKYPYVSCIKINGVPILPPVVTPEFRKELHQYKQQAIKLEQRLKNCRDLKKNLDELLESQNENIRPVSQLTFSDNSHIEALNIFDNLKGQKEYKKSNLSRDIIEVTQYDGNGMTTICSNIKCTDNFCQKKPCDSEKTDYYENSDAEGAKDVPNNRIDEQIFTNDNINLYQCYDSEFHKPATLSQPRLIRSNSYTLESPSPILLAHLQKTSCMEGKNGDSNSLVSARIWTSLENNHTSFESSDFSSTDTVYHKEPDDRNSEKSEVVSSPDKASKIINEVKSPTIEVYQTDISVQQITINTTAAAENGVTKEEKTEKFLAKNPFDVFEPDGELLDVLKDIPETYANQIIELLRIQHLEQQERLERYDNLSCSPEKSLSTHEVFKSQSNSEKVKNEGIQSRESLHPFTSSSPLPPTLDNITDQTSKRDEDSVAPPVEDSSNRPHTTESCTKSDKPHTEKLRRSSTFSMSPSQSLYYSISSDTDSISLTVPTSPSVKLIDLESNNGEDLEIGVLRENNGYWEGVMMHENAKNMNCSRELFPEIDPVTINVIKREWAASVIGAHVKGYLIRRLLRTGKVQSLIATIKDVLMCAVELHHSENIDEKDVELHRRLINQLSAALYAFHDTFFDLSIPEQMLIIAADRQRKREKPKRPQSAKTSSRPVSGRSTNSSRSNKSLPSSRSSSKHKLISGSPSLTKV